MALTDKLRFIEKKYLVPVVLSAALGLGGFGCGRVPEKGDIVVYKEYQPMRAYFYKKEWDSRGKYIHIDDEDYIAVVGRIPPERKDDTKGDCKSFSSVTIYLKKVIYD